MQESLQGYFEEHWSCQPVHIEELAALSCGARGIHVFRSIHIRATPPIGMDPMHAAKLQEV